MARLNYLEAAGASVKAAGGEITLAIFAFPGGRRFHFCDPAGHDLGWCRSILNKADDYCAIGADA